VTEANAERTLIVVKPDGVERLLVGRILVRFEERGLRIAALKMLRPTRDLAERHYAVHRLKPFYEGLLDFITSGPVVAAVLEGPNAIALARTMLGATRPEDAAPGTIRGDYALDVGQNLVHASDGAETAAHEIALWFEPAELQDYVRDLDTWIVAPG
jgi:nucleoside-diphosphate kinase